jgi:hypothetical protein
MTKPAGSLGTFDGQRSGEASPALVALRDEPEMADCTFPSATITITLSGRLMLELAQMAREADTTEDDLAHRAIKSLVQAHRSPGIPRFARRLGPLALAEDDPSAA